MEFLKNFAAGTLSDGQIKAGCAEGWLICDNFDPKCVMQACYELRASNVYYELDGIDGKSAPVRMELSDDEFILLKPKQLITVITLEFLKLPDNVLGRVLTKGKLFSVGLAPVNTYADPGFSGRLGIVIANLSYNYIAIRQGQPIAKIEFSKLRNTVEQSYSGQHGYQTEMWPVPNEMILSRESLIAAGDKRVLSIEEELALTNGKLIGGVANRIFAVERKLLFVTILYLVFSTALIGYMASQGNHGAISQVVSLLLGVVSNAVFWAITYSATNLFRK